MPSRSSDLVPEPDAPPQFVVLDVGAGGDFLFQPVVFLQPVADASHLAPIPVVIGP